MSRQGKKRGSSIRAEKKVIGNSVDLMVVFDLKKKQSVNSYGWILLFEKSNVLTFDRIVSVRLNWKGEIAICGGKAQL